MSKIVIIAGPQAAGKSSILAKLGSQPSTVEALFPGGKAPLLFPVQESRQIVVHKHMLLGAIFMTAEEEREVVQCDLERMDIMLRRNEQRFIYLDECNIFTIAHAAAHGVTEIEHYWQGYIKRLTELNASVILLDVLPNISWDRRSCRYEQRLVYFPPSQHAEIRQRYQEYLMKLHPLLHEIYQRLPFPKVIVDGHSSEENVLRKVCQVMDKLLGGFA